MKLTELEQLDEISLRHAAAAGALGLAAMGSPTASSPSGIALAPQTKVTHPAVNRMFTKTADFIADTYKIDQQLAYKIVELAHKYEDPVFPKAKDILSVIGIESSFNPDAVSGLKKDPARGLMQVRPGVWGIPLKDLKDIENQIAYGTKILKEYHQRLRSKWKALHAYNVGLTKFRRGEDNPAYVEKFRSAQKQFTGI